MMNKHKLAIKKTDLQAHTDYELECLVKQQPFFLDCTLEKSSDEILFEFDITNTQPLANAKTYPLVYRYHILLSLRSLLKFSFLYDISLDPKYLYINSSFQILIMKRDISSVYYVMNVNQLKALIGYLLQEKYTYEDYYFGGIDLLKKNVLTKPFYELETIDEIMDLLEERLRKEEESEASMISLTQSKWKKMRIVNGGVKVLCLIFMVLFVYFGIYQLYHEMLFNQASQAYIQQDYSKVIETLENMKTKSMNMQVLSLLSESYVKSEPLSQEQKNNILSTISIRSDQKILEYWICIGRNDATGAIDYAHQLNNVEYLAYAYMKKQEVVESDTSLSVKDKQTQLDEIESQLKKLEVNE